GRADLERTLRPRVQRVSPRAERLREIFDQVIGVLEADGDAEQALRGPGVGAFDGGAVLDQALDPAQAGRAGEDPELHRHLERAGAAALDLEREHAAEARHLAGGDLVARMIGETGEVDPEDGGVPGEELGEDEGILAVRAHPGGERPHAPQHEPAVERRGAGSRGRLDPPDALPELALLAGDESPAEDVAVAAEVLRRRMEDEIRPEVERALEHGGRPGVVDQSRGAVGSCQRGERSDVRDAEERIRRGLDPDQTRLPPQRLLDLGDLVHAYDARLEPPAAEGLEQEVARAVKDVVRDDHVVARRERLEERRGGGRAGRESRRLGSPLERGESSLEIAAVRLALAGVGEAPRVGAVLLPFERRREVDRRRHAARGGFDSAAGMDGEGFEFHCVSTEAGDASPASLSKVDGRRAERRGQPRRAMLRSPPVFRRAVVSLPRRSLPMRRSMHRPVRFGFVLLLLLSLGRFAAASDETVPALLGFSAERSAAERALEKKLDAALDREDQKAWMKRLTAHPHHIGSEYDRQNSLFIADLFRSWGFTTRIEDFYPLFPTPKERVLELIAPTRFQPTLSEPPVPGDASSAQSAEMLPPFNAYSIDGDVTGELVYVNYGTPDDYEQLERRGIKPKVAAEHGAIGCILYSDPADDGYGVGDVYPKGGWRNDRAVQRGSVADGPLHSGDPLTPGVGATKDAQRLDRKDAKTITKIPVLPISYGDALPFLKALDGPVVPPDWRGALPIAYHFGPGPAKVHLKLVFDWKLTPIHDVIAVLPGAELPDEWVIRGNHYDAWVHGALDPISGMVAVLSEAKAIGALAKDGWRPRRTLVYAAWDAEEPGLLGSVEWAETHADELRAKAVAYVNSDSNSRGYLGIRGSSSLEAMINDVARDVVDPEKSVSVWTRARATALIDGTAEEKREARDRANLRIGPLGSGSDYTPFLQHLGIAALDLGYGGEEQYGQYHTAYDNFEHFSRFVDPDFAYGVILAQTGGRTVLRLAEADVLPFEFTGSADTISKYVD